jgi:hypothetical protein
MIFSGIGAFGPDGGCVGFAMIDFINGHSLSSTSGSLNEAALFLPVEERRIDVVATGFGTDGDTPGQCGGQGKGHEKELHDENARLIS